MEITLKEANNWLVLHKTRLFMARPDPPAVDSDEYKVWKTQLAIPYTDGYVEATYGDLIQTFDLGDMGDTCEAKTISSSVKEQTRYNKIGGTGKTILPFTRTFQSFPRKNSSNAAGGALYTFHTDIGTYSARVGGDVQAMAKWLCSMESKVYGTLRVQTGSGAWYGPYSATV